MIYIALCLCFICMAFMGYTISLLGESYFSAVSRNPTIADTASKNLLLLMAAIELGALVLIVFGFMLILK